MQTQKLSLTKTAWTPLLSDGGSVLIQGGGGAIALCWSDSGVPALDADALRYEEYQIRNGVSFNNIPAGTALYARSTTTEAIVRIVK